MKKEISDILKNNISPMKNAVIHYEILDLFNSACQFENKDKGSIHYKQSSISRFVEMFTGESKELNVNPDIINKYLDLPDGEAKSLRDVFYKENVRRTESEISMILNPVKEMINKYKPTALNYTHIDMHDTQLTLSEHLDIAKEVLEEEGILVEGKIDNDAVELIDLKYKNEKSSFNDVREEYSIEENPMANVVIGMGEDDFNNKNKKIEKEYENKLNKIKRNKIK